MEKLKVTAFIVVYNEEARIERLLQSLKWADEIIVYDKESPDKTQEIARKYTDKVFSIPYNDGGALGVEKVIVDAKHEWIFPITAAGLVHPKVILKVAEYLAQDDFPYDVIAIPYKIYAFGIHSPHSPWYQEHKEKFMKKSVMKPSDQLHHELTLSTNRIFNMPWIDDEAVCYHLTHRDMDDFFAKHTRYTRYEADYLKKIHSTQSMWRPFYEIIKSVGVALLKRRVYLEGWNGVALGLGYVSYFIMKFLYIWDSRRINGNSVYPEIQEKIRTEWEKYEFKS